MGAESLEVRVLRGIGSAVTRIFISAIVASFAGLVLELAVVGAALAGGVFEFGGSNYVEVNGGPFAWLLVLGMVSLGTAAMMAYVVAGPDGTRQASDRPVSLSVDG